MKVTVTAIALAAIFFSARFACADFYDDCSAECGSAQKQCIDAITLYDETGVREAKAECSKQLKACGKKCHDMDDMGVDAYNNMLKQQEEQAEQKKQEQELQETGGIKTYKFSD